MYVAFCKVRALPLTFPDSYFDTVRKNKTETQEEGTVHSPGTIVCLILVNSSLLLPPIYAPPFLPLPFISLPLHVSLSLSPSTPPQTDTHRVGEEIGTSSNTSMDNRVQCHLR